MQKYRFVAILLCVAASVYFVLRTVYSSQRGASSPARPDPRHVIHTPAQMPNGPPSAPGVAVVQPPPPLQTPPPSAPAHSKAFERPSHRYVVFRQTDDTGWGNRMRGMIAAAVFSVITERRFVIDHPYYFTHFDSPSAAFSLNYNEVDEVQTLSKARGNVRGYPFGPGVDAFKSLTKYLNASADVDFKESVITFGCGCTFDAIFFENPSTLQKIEAAFGTRDRAKVSEMILKWLLSRPSKRFAETVRRTKGRIKFRGPAPVVYMQVRTWADMKWAFAGDRTLKVLLDELTSAWADHGWNNQTDVTIFVTSDGKSVLETMKTKLGAKFGSHVHVIWNDAADTFNHTITDTAADDAKKGKEKKIGGAMIDWFLMGEPEVKLVLCSGTTFCISGTGRTGFTQKKKDIRFCSPPSGKEAGRFRWEGRGPRHKVW